MPDQGIATGKVDVAVSAWKVSTHRRFEFLVTIFEVLFELEGIGKSSSPWGGSYLEQLVILASVENELTVVAVDLVEGVALRRWQVGFLSDLSHWRRER